MNAIVFSGGRKALAFADRRSICMRMAGNSSRRPTPGSADLCFITDVPLTEVVVHWNAEGVAIVEGPVERTGATGPILSIYFRDPDDNLIEVCNALAG